MKGLLLGSAIGILGASIVVACSTTVGTVGTGGAGGQGAGAAGTAGRAAGGGGLTATTQGTGGEASDCKIYDAGVGGDADAWGCNFNLGLLPPSECGKHGNLCTFCQAPLLCGWVGQYFDCGGCAWGANYDCEYDPPPDHACSFDHGWGPVPTDPDEYWEVCPAQYCRQFPDGHYNCCDNGAPIVASGDGKMAYYLHCPCQ